jgi:hypothetical protein
MHDAGQGRRLQCLTLLLVCPRRFTFTLSPGQVPLQMSSFFTLSPKAGVFVTPRLRAVNVP